MDLSGLVEIFFILDVALSRVTEEEGIMCVASRMCLGLEERVEIPEGAFHVAISPHLLKAHLSEHFCELLFGLHQGMQVSIVHRQALRVGIELLEAVSFPTSIQQHTTRKLRLNILQFLPVVLPLLDNVNISVSFLHQFSPLELLDHLRGKFLIIF